MNTNFSSLSSIQEYNFKTIGEINDALGSLEAMYTAKNISEYQYKNMKRLLEDKKKSLE